MNLLIALWCYKIYSSIYLHLQVKLFSKLKRKRDPVNLSILGRDWVFVFFYSHLEWQQWSSICLEYASYSSYKKWKRPCRQNIYSILFTRIKDRSWSTRSSDLQKPVPISEEHPKWLWHACAYQSLGGEWKKTALYCLSLWGRSMIYMSPYVLRQTTKYIFCRCVLRTTPSCHWRSRCKNMPLFNFSTPFNFAVYSI